MSFLDHLEELRWHIIRSIVAVLVMMIIVFTQKSLLFDRLILAYQDPNFITYKWLCQISQNLKLGEALCIDSVGFTLQNIEMAGQFLLHLKVSFVLGFVMAFPFVLFEVWRFIKPGLHAKEKTHTTGFVFFTSFLFMFGVCFGYLILAPFSIQFLGNYNVSNAVENSISLTSYVNIISTLVLSTGMIFELPMLSYLLSKLGILTPKLMRKYRKHAVVGLLSIAAIITPPDVTSQILIVIPLYLLYEVSILISGAVHRKRKRELA